MLTEGINTVRGNSKEMQSNIVDDLMCIRLLYQNVFDMRTAETLVTVTRNDVKTNFDCPVSTCVCIPKEANRCNILWKLQKRINSLLILPTRCRALGSSLGVTASHHFFHFPNCTCCTGWICRRGKTVH